MVEMWRSAFMLLSKKSKIKNNKEKEKVEEQENTRTTKFKNRKNITMYDMSSKADDKKIAPPNLKSLKFGRSRT